MNPFQNFYHVPSSEELLDIAFKKGMKSSAKVSSNAPILLKAKRKESKRVKVAFEELIDRIVTIIKMVPMISELPDFYRELSSVLVNVDEMKLALGKLNGILTVLRHLERDFLKKIGRIESPSQGDRLRSEAFGRISSVINKQNKNLLYLNSIRGRLKEIPSIDHEVSCVVVAGSPNVGKSSLVKEISTNKKIEVQEYPFTTKKLFLGHIEFKSEFDNFKIQIIDTPGILDRPMSNRNYMELQSILALRYISDLIVFIFDPTPSSGYSVDSQIDLYKEIKDSFAKDRNIDMVVVFNKMDLARKNEIEDLRTRLNLKESEIFLTNALTGENLSKLTEYLEKRYVKSAN